MHCRCVTVYGGENREGVREREREREVDGRREREREREKEREREWERPLEASHCDSSLIEIPSQNGYPYYKDCCI